MSLPGSFLPPGGPDRVALEDSYPGYTTARDTCLSAVTVPFNPLPPPAGCAGTQNPGVQK